jgi:hypothetical protein
MDGLFGVLVHQRPKQRSAVDRRRDFEINYCGGSGPLRNLYVHGNPKNDELQSPALRGETAEEQEESIGSTISTDDRRRSEGGRT